MNEIDNDFQHQCGCEKKYKSFLALRNHCKVKHNGKFPDGT